MKQALVYVVFFVAFAGCKATFKPVPEMNFPPGISQRARLENYAVYGDHPELLVGKIVVVVKKNGICPTGRLFDADFLSADSYLAANAKVEPKTLSNVLYQGAIKQGADLDLVIATFGTKTGGAVAAEVIVTDIQEAIGEPLIDQTKLQTLAARPLPSNVCERILVKNVRVSLVHYKTYQEATSDLGFTGTAFGFGSEVYHTQNRFQADYIVAMDIYRVPAPGAGFEAREFVPVMRLKPDAALPETSVY